MSSKSHKTRPEPAWETVYSLYERVLEAPAEKRPALAEELCAGDPELLQEVLFLVENTEPADRFLEKPALAKLAQALAPGDLQPGDRIEDFRIEGLLGRGAFAAVYRARQISLDREVALKVSPIFGQEGRTVAQLDHEGIVPVYLQTNLREKNLRLIAMQLIQGLTLEAMEKRLPEAPFLNGEQVLRCLDEGVSQPPVFTADAFRDRQGLATLTYTEAVACLGIRIAEALAHAHSLGILHLDVKPSNILLPPSAKPKLTDFNVSAAMDALAEGVPEQFGGTADYMAPEHRAVFMAQDKAAAAKELDARADIYSLGVVLKRLLKHDKIRKVRDEIDWILDRATAEHASDRYPDAASFARALNGYVELKAIRSSLPRGGKLLQMARRSPLAMLTLLGAIPQMAAGAFGIAYNSSQIVRMLNPVQQEMFRNLNYVYNPVLYFLASLIWAYGLMRVFPVLAKPNEFVSRQPALSRLRTCALRLPLLGCGITTLGWIPAALLFPSVLHYAGGGLPPLAIGHFFISFVLSYGIALAYSFLFHEWVFLNAIYSLYWPGTENIAETAAKELRNVPKHVRIACILATFFPLMGAALLILVGPETLAGHQYRTFRMLSAGLIFLGAVGVSFAFSFAQQIARVIFRFTSPKRAIDELRG